ncbi:MAG: NIPSNAP family protein [Acidobacteriia bacterium]|nr:NIPSNAP family protein [Terriglobia bacterium]
MTRRNFSGLLAGFVAFPGFGSADPSAVVVLRAIAGARLPETLAITTSFPEKLRQGLWELRTYRGAAPALATQVATVFRGAGIRPLLSETNGENLTYLIPFENLAARDRAWTTVNADPEWMRARGRFQSYHFGLYRSA